MSWNTKITKLLNIDYPIIQGAMAYISDGVLAAAMSHAGCAGVIGSGGFTPDEVQSHIRRFKDIAGSQKVSLRIYKQRNPAAENFHSECAGVIDRHDIIKK